MTSSAHRHNIGLSEPDLEKLLDNLESILLDMDGDGRRKRQEERLPWRHRDVLVRAEHLGGGRAEYLVATHDLSRGGLAFVHGGFLHEGTPLEIDLPQSSPGLTERVTARVAWCRFLTQSVHVSGVKFDEPIELQRHIERSQWPESLLRRVRQDEELHGRLLFLDDEMMDRELFAMTLSETRLKVATVGGVGEAIDHIKSNRVDLLLCDFFLEDEDASSVLPQLREAGYDGPVVVISADPRAGSMLQSAGVHTDDVIVKPYEPALLEAVIGAQLKRSGANESDEPIYCKLHFGPDTAEAVEKYVRSARDLAEKLRAGLNKGDLTAVRKACQTFKGTGAGFGYPCLSEGATEALKAIDASQSVEESRGEIRRLIRTVERLIPEPSPERSASRRSA